MNSATIYPLEENVVYGEGYRVPSRLKTETRGAYVVFNPGIAWIKVREAEEMAEEKRFSGAELAAEYWFLRYMAESARLNSAEWENEIGEYEYTSSLGYKNALEKITYWLSVVHAHERELDIINRFRYTCSYDED